MVNWRLDPRFWSRPCHQLTLLPHFSKPQFTHLPDEDSHLCRIHSTCLFRYLNMFNVLLILSPIQDLLSAARHVPGMGLAPGLYQQAR